jgi:hypothetical protein
MKTILPLLIILFFSNSLFAQSDSTGWGGKPEVKMSGFLDVFYAYDFNEPQGSSMHPFFFNFNRQNEINMNLGVLQIDVQHQKYRATLALQAGTYPNDNYAPEEGTLKNINQATVGISLNKKNNLWLDAGLMNSYIGFESAISVDNPTLTRSLSAASSPFFITGAKLTYTPSDKIELAGIVTNGWQRIQRVPGNSLLSFGTELIYTPNKNITLNWSTFIGTDDPDSLRRMRYFNDFYGIFQLSKKWILTAGFDIGFQQTAKDSSDYNMWLTPVVIIRYAINENWAMALRGEYFDDEEGLIIPTVSSTGFQTSGVSLNIDWMPNKWVMCRIEGRYLKAQDSIFEKKGGYSDNDFFITASMAISINR